MALDKEYFDSIHIDVVKKKYYNANKVNAVFEDIRRQAQLLSEDNRRMKDQLEALNGSRVEIGDAILTAQSVYKELIEKADRRAQEIVSQAEDEREQILAEARARQDYSVQQVERCFSRMKEHYLSGIEAINADWQEFLCGLYTDDEPPAAAGPGISTEDIENRIKNIAEELFSDSL